MSGTTIDIETLTEWGPPKQIETRAGLRNLRRSLKPVPREFSALWKENKDALKAAGIAWEIKNDEFTGHINWWQPVDAAQAAAINAEREAAAAKAAVSIEASAFRLREVSERLLPYQRASAAQQLEALIRHGSALDASDTGTGKTYVNLAVAFALDAPVYVVCPKAVRPSWQRAARHVGTRLVGVCNYEMLRRGADTVRITEERGKQKFEWRLPAGTIIIFDECHRMKDHKTLNCALGLSALRQGYRVLGLSATAADNPMQMKFSALLTGMIAREKEFYPWMMRNGVGQGRFGLEFDGRTEHLAKIHRHIFPSHGTRIRIADLGDQFPETQIIAEAYDLSENGAAIQRAYEEMQAEISRIRARAERDTEDCILTVLLRARQQAETLKVPAIVDMAEDAEAEGMSVAIFTNFDAPLDIISSKLKTKSVIRGQQGDDERQQAIDDFNADRSHFIVCNIKAGGVGVSLHGTAQSRMRLAIICPTFSGQDLKQALGRVWRANGAKSIQRIFFAAGTIEEDVCRGVNEKIQRIDLLNDGSLDFALTMQK